ncbi:biliverdin-producing heme oxygenase [Asticcacaulis sp. YBE204]|uniref:biliverdin-producing heme oxygenase n=1 Tax=Asticcacaulis sp. YBE204 TaxID=1282363 RepID=UPI0003C3B4E6|nr:biliverdin-producing heme oxygenase [Asticcacaulis sp. YBE204]ESQ79530.1 hypothetical protein AEYBE204_06715 [Asticcacaulis sp. YBE204]
MRLLEALRLHTRAQHDALHRHPLLAGLSPDGPALTLTDFGRIVQAFEACYRHVEAALTTPLPDDVPDAPVLDWLSRDLRHLGLPHRTIAFDHPPVDSLAKRLGYLYTKQGSTLGGHVISKHLERQLGLRPHVDQWFFAGYGTDNGPQWKRFVAALDHHAAKVSADEVIAAAATAFETIAHFCDTTLLQTTETLHEA